MTPARRAYIESIKRLIRARDVEVDAVVVRRLDAERGRQLMTALDGDDPDGVLYALELLELSGEIRTHREQLARLLRHPNQDVRHGTAAALVKHGDDALLNAIQPLLEDDDLGTRAEAVRLLCRHCLRDELQSFQMLLSDSRIRVRAGAVAGGFEHRDPRFSALAEKELQRLATESGVDGSANRREATLLTAIFPAGESTRRVLLQLLEDSDESVRRAAIVSASRGQPRDAVPLVIRALQSPRTRDEARGALVTSGGITECRCGHDFIVYEDDWLETVSSLHAGIPDRGGWEYAPAIFPILPAVLPREDPHVVRHGPSTHPAGRKNHMEGGRMVRGLLIFASLVLIPAPLFAQAAQASITGVVRDTSGAILPGVTVEISSPALIERTRSMVTDGTGRYRFIDLRPGTYTVVFRLQGFSVVRREGLVLSGALVATVDAEMQIGTLEETITVTGEAPIVDVQSAGRQQTVDKDVITAIPSSRLYHSIVSLVPGVVTSGTQDVGGLDGPSFKLFSIHGGRVNEGLVNVDGLNVGAGLNGSGVSYYVADIGNSEEISMTLSGGGAESDRGGPVLNVVPRQGGNSYNGTFFATGSGGGLQSSNFDQELKDAGLRTPNELRKIWDINGSFGGPILRDKLWFFWTGRHQGNRKFVTGMFLNANAGDPTKWTYEASDTRATDGGTWKSSSIRLTWQATARNKFNVFWDHQAMCSSGCVEGSITGGTPTISPEAHQPTEGWPTNVRQLTWTSPVTSRILLDAAVGTNGLRWGGKERPGNNRELIPVQEQAGEIPDIWYRGQRAWSRHFIGVNSWRASASYITGAHSLKAGYQGNYYVSDTTNFRPDARLEYRLNGGQPNRLTMYGDWGAKTRNRTAATMFFAQEQWTRNRLTLQGGLRYERAWSWAPEQRIGPDLFLPNEIVLPRASGVDAWNDIVFRSAATYDLFGNGRTALKVNLGEYLEANQNSGLYTSSNPRNRIPTNTNRNWTDADGDFVPDCDLLNPAANGECGPWADQSFGQERLIAQVDPDLSSGWNVRPSDWQFGVGIQHQVLPRLSVEVSYNRRWFEGLQVTDDLSVTAADYQEYSIVAPNDPRLPGGGGGAIGDLYDLTPQAAFGRVRDDFITRADKFGDWISYWHGLDISFNSRLQNGVLLQGGFSVGRSVEDICDIGFRQGNTVNVDNPSRRFCRVVEPWRGQTKLLASYTIPTVDVLVSGTFQSTPGDDLSANLVVLSSQTTLGRALTTGVAIVDLVEPQTVFNDRINNVDLRFAKVLRMSGRRAQVSVDLFNAFNSNAVENRIQTFGGRWLVPTSVLSARFVKISGQIDF